MTTRNRRPSFAAPAGECRWCGGPLGGRCTMADGSSCGWITVARTLFVEIPREHNRLRPGLGLAEDLGLLDRMPDMTRRLYARACRVAFEEHWAIILQMMPRPEGT